MTEKSLLFVPMFVLMTTAYVACSDDSGDYDVTPKQSYIDGGFGALVDVKGSEVAWPDVADAEDDDVDDAPMSGGG